MKKTIKIVESNVNQRGRLSRYLNEKLLDYVYFRTDVLILLEYNSLSVNSGFLYGVPYPFKTCGWYYIRGFKYPVCDRFLIATTEMTIVDAEELCSVGECI